MYVCMYVCMLQYCLTKANTDRNNFNSKKKKLSVVDNNADKFIHFGLSFRQADHWLVSRLFCPSCS